ncbi:MAG: hypothetical protein BGN97_17185 [Microbacterium sp. 69-10]|uniref:TetR/AcrR family transcriptional regulator n=1 Tax=Microbacterium sp. 69-10 TaxID=1895783 RepID=UPI0009634813|nr:TetR/AcrR family transcriptional regulator [Microbacterium sp. 69-10]OJU41128.1 MAG: hypothetical protein BGN97_17185 [Microbacterium sp. 69-10]
MPEPRTTRTYRSDLRTEQAAATRRRVLDAAAASFAEGGYSGASLAEIGRRAGVSAETVKANGPKRDLLLGAFEQAFAGAEGEAQLADSAEGARIAALDDGEALLAAAAELIAAANARTSVLWIEILSAAGADPAIAEALEVMLARRMDDYRATVRLLVERGIAPAGTDIDGAAAALSFLWSPEGHQQLVLQSGWSMRRYTAWLCDAARRQLG